jgi:hypothetical protein
MLKEELYTQSQVDAIEYLAKGFAKAEERKEIIKLIEEQTAHHAKTHYQGSNCSTCNLIALIKERSR